MAQIVNQLRKAFPATVTSETVKKLGIAPNNESYVINTLQFIGVLDTDGKRTEVGHAAFLEQKDEDFNKAFEALVRRGMQIYLRSTRKVLGVSAVMNSLRFFARVIRRAT